LCNGAESGRDDAPCHAECARWWVSMLPATRTARTAQTLSVPTTLENEHFVRRRYHSCSTVMYRAVGQTTVFLLRLPGAPGRRGSQPQPPPGSSGCPFFFVARVTEYGTSGELHQFMIVRVPGYNL